MSGGIQVGRGVRMYGVPAGTREAKKAESRACGFLEMARSAQSVDAYVEHLREKYGRVTIESVGKDEISLQKAGGRMSGHDVVIAPNILEEMANNPEKAAHYEKIIDDFFASQPMVKAQMAAGGFEIQSYGVVIHPDGTANYYVCGDVSPEKKAKIEAQMKAEDEAKAKRKRQYRERSRKAAEERKQQMELLNKKQSVTDFLANHTTDMGKFTYISTPKIMSVAVAAYERNIM